MIAVNPALEPDEAAHFGTCRRYVCGWCDELSRHIKAAAKAERAARDRATALALAAGD